MKIIIEKEELRSFMWLFIVKRFLIRGWLFSAPPISRWRTQCWMKHLFFLLSKKVCWLNNDCAFVHQNYSIQYIYIYISNIYSYLLQTTIATMNLTTAARRLLLTSPLLAVTTTNVAAFSSRSRLPSAVVGRAPTPTRAFTSSTASLQMANVLKLSDPQSELLDDVDVFIFDCDGVIWRVCIAPYCTVINVVQYLFFCVMSCRRVVSCRVVCR